MQESEREKSFREALFSGEMDMDGMDAVLALYRELYPGRTEPSPDLRIPDPGEIAVRLQEGFTILDPAEILPGPGGLAARGKEVSRILARHSEDPDPAAKAMDSLLTDPPSFLSLARAVLLPGSQPSGEQPAPFEGMNREILVFIIFNATKNLFLRAAQKLAGTSTTQWDHGRCPVCGGGPAAAYLLGEGGKRFLLCHRCESRWRFRRMSCPFCGKDSPEGSRYVYTEKPEYKGVTGQVCDGCQCYIKTWRCEDEDLGSLHPEVEDLKTPAFDVALEKEGFHRCAPNIFGVRVGQGSGGK